MAQIQALVRSVLLQCNSSSAAPQVEAFLCMPRARQLHYEIETAILKAWQEHQAREAGGPNDTDWTPAKVPAGAPPDVFVPTVVVLDKPAVASDHYATPAMETPSDTPEEEMTASLDHADSIPPIEPQVQDAVAHVSGPPQLPAPVEPQVQEPTRLPTTAMPRAPNMLSPPQKAPSMIVKPTSDPALRFRLPNASEGKSYEAVLSLETGAPLPADLTIVCIEGLEQVGLQYNANTGQVSGVPSRNGELRLTVVYRRASMLAERFEHAAMSFTINPDPENLWRSIPSDQSLPFWKPDSAALSAWLVDRRVLAASQRGRSHAQYGACRDDDMAILQASRGWTVMAVADGAGSARFSRHGSELAAQVATTTVRDLLEGEVGQALEKALADWSPDPVKATPPLHREFYRILPVAAFEAVKALRRAAEAQSPSATLRDFATTLILTLYRPWRGGHLVAAFWVGDGAVAVHRYRERVILLGDGDGGEYAGQTRFLDSHALQVSNDIMHRIRVTWLPAMTALIAMTDGVSDPCFESDQSLQAVQPWDALWEMLAPFAQAEDPRQAEAQLLDWLNFRARGHHDDRTLAMVVPWTSTAQAMAQPMPVGEERG